MRTFGKRGGFVHALNFAVTPLLLQVPSRPTLCLFPLIELPEGMETAHHHPPHGFPFQTCPRVLNLCC